MNKLINNWERNFKTKQEAIVHIFDCLTENPAVADQDGTLKIMFGGEFITIKPKKKKKESRLVTSPYEA